VRFLLSRWRFVLAVPHLICCAGAPPVDSALVRPSDSSCELSPKAIEEVSELDQAFEQHAQPSRRQTIDGDGYGYELDDDPMGETVEDGACACLAYAISAHTAESCASTLRAASICLGGPGSQRLWAHRNCLPYRANASASQLTIELAVNGCTIPDSASLAVRR